MFIVMTNFGQLVYMQKPKQLSKLITNGSNKEKTKRIEQFPKNPGIEYKANTVYTGILQKYRTVPYRNEIPHTAGAWRGGPDQKHLWKL